VRLAKEKEEQSVDVEKLKKQLTILMQKKIRTEGMLQYKSAFLSTKEREF
jgi:hypothetical protein